MFNTEKRSAIEFLLSSLTLNRYQSSTSRAKIKLRLSREKGLWMQVQTNDLSLTFRFLYFTQRIPQKYAKLLSLMVTAENQKIRPDRLGALQCQPYKNSTGFHGHVFLMLRECANGLSVISIFTNAIQEDKRSSVATRINDRFRLVTVSRD